MKIMIELAENELGHDIAEQIMIASLKCVLKTVNDCEGYTHPSDLKYNKKLSKAIRLILEYYGEKDE